LILSFDIKIRN